MTKDMQTEQLLCWNGMTDACTPQSSNEEDQTINGQLRFSNDSFVPVAILQQVA